MLVLLPVQFVILPFNVSLVDLWNLVALPLCWLHLLRVRQPIRLPYFAALWLVLVASLVATLASPDLQGSLAVVLKEAYLCVWFATLAAVFVSLDQTKLRRLLLVWCVVAVLQGLLISAQFFSPVMFQSTKTFLEQFGAVDVWRPSGTFENANAAAFFQLFGFVPLVLLCLPSSVGIIVGILLVISIIGTGSLGAVAAFLASLGIGLVVTAVRRGDWRPLVKVATLSAVAVAFLAGLMSLLISQLPDVAARLEYMFYGRTERSAEGRFGLWTRGTSLFLTEMPLLGVGPDAFMQLNEATLKIPSQKATYLHNDMFAFLIERGVAGLLGLILLGVMVVGRSIRLLKLEKSCISYTGPPLVIFLAAMVGTLIESQTHQVFHARQVWLTLAFQEAMLARVMNWQKEGEIVSVMEAELLPFYRSVEHETLSAESATEKRRNFANII